MCPRSRSQVRPARALTIAPVLAVFASTQLPAATETVRQAELVWGRLPFSPRLTSREDGVSGILAPAGDGSALGAAVGRVLTDPVLRQRLSAAAGERVALFSMDRTAAATLAVYRKVLGQAVL